MAVLMGNWYCVFLEGVYRAVSESAEECSRAALVHAHCWVQQEETLDC